MDYEFPNRPAAKPGTNVLYNQNTTAVACQGCGCMPGVRANPVTMKAGCRCRCHVGQGPAEIIDFGEAKRKLEEKSRGAGPQQ